MEYRLLGNTNMNISRIAFGCMSLMPGAPGNGDLLRAAVDAGINYFDTADLYNNGLNEELVGATLRNLRSRIFIATKVGNQVRPDGKGWDWNPSAKYILEAVEKSLRRLQTDHIDLYQLHGGTMEDPIDETIAAFEKLKQEGKIRYYGISSIRPVVIREWVERSGMSSVMTQYSLVDRRPEEETLDLLLRNHIGVLARGSLAQGMLVNKPARDQLGRSATEVATASAFLNRQAIPAAALGIQYVLHHPGVTAAVVGIRTQEQLQEAIGVMQQPALSDDLYASMQNLLPPNFYAEHR